MRDGEGGLEDRETMIAPVTTHEPEGRVTLRLYVVSPPPGMVHAIIDTNEVPVAPLMSRGEPLYFLFSLSLERSEGRWRFKDDCVRMAEDRGAFLMIAAGSHAGQLNSTTGGRARVFLPPVTEDMVGLARTGTLTIEGLCVARNPDGGPIDGDIDVRWRDDGNGWLYVRHRLAHDVLEELVAHFRQWIPIADAIVYGHDGYRYDLIVVLNTRADVQDAHNSTTLASMREFARNGLIARNMGDPDEICVEISLYALDDENQDYLDHFRPGAILRKWTPDFLSERNAGRPKGTCS